MALSPHQRQVARLSLVAVWLWTAFVSVHQMPGMSVQLLQANGHIPPQAYPWLIYSGAAVDLMIGLLMLLKPGKAVYLAALLMTVTMTLVGTWVDPSLWLHPLGPMSKNLPIFALLWILAREPA